MGRVYLTSVPHEHFAAAISARRAARPPEADYARDVDDDDLPDARDGLTRRERVVLWVLSELQEEEGGRTIRLPMLYGRVVEHADMSIAELQQIVARLGARRL